MEDIPLQLQTCTDSPYEVFTIETKDKDKEKDKTQDLLVIAEDAPRVARVARQKKIPPRSEGVVLDATDAKGLVQIGQLLEWNSA